MSDLGVEAKQLAIQAKDAILNSEIVENLKNSFNSISDDAKSAIKEVKSQLEEWAKIQIERAIRNLLQQCPPLIKQKIIDKHMCECVKDLVSDLVDDIWPEIEEEIIYQLRYKIDYLEKYKVEQIPASDCCLGRCCQAFRRWYLYTTQPVDKTIWQRMRWFSFWFLTIIKSFPFYGVSPIFLLLDFFMIDKGDEFQLCQFIVNFKKMHFISFGIIRGLTGFIFYYLCMLRNRHIKSTAEYFFLKINILKIDVLI